LLNSENDYDWNCYFKVDLSSKDITADQIKYCTSLDSCGSQNIFGSKNVPSSYNITANYLPFLVVKESYSVFVVCYHNIIGATVSSNVNVAFKFTVECSNNYKLVNDECVKDDTYVNGTIIDIQNNTSTNSNNTNSNFTSTNYLQRMNLYLGLILLFILLT